MKHAPDPLRIIPLLVVAAFGTARAALAEASEVPPPPLSFGAVLEEALRHNVALREARARTGVARKRVDGAGRWADFEVQYQQWATPLDRPWAVGESDMVMLGVRRAIPVAGLPAARRTAAQGEAAVAEARARSLALDVVAQLRRTWAGYVAAYAERTLLAEQRALAERVVALARAQYANGRVGQADVLRAGRERARLEPELARIEEDLAVAASLLNALMGRHPAAPLGPPAPGDASPAAGPVASVREDRPELVAARAEAERSGAALEAMRLEAGRPAFMLGADYAWAPMRPFPHAYFLMGSMTLPWFTSGRDAEVRAAEEEVVADRLALDAVRLVAEQQLVEAAARERAVRVALRSLDTELLPLAEQELEASRIGYATGRDSVLAVLDSARALLDLGQERLRLQARLAIAVADRDRAAGLPDLSALDASTQGSRP